MCIKNANNKNPYNNLNKKAKNNIYNNNMNLSKIILRNKNKNID